MGDDTTIDMEMDEEFDRDWWEEPEDEEPEDEVQEVIDEVDQEPLVVRGEDGPEFLPQRWAEMNRRLFQVNRVMQTYSLSSSKDYTLWLDPYRGRPKVLQPSIQEVTVLDGVVTHKRTKTPRSCNALYKPGDKVTVKSEFGQYNATVEGFQGTLVKVRPNGFTHNSKVNMTQVQYQNRGV